MDWRGDYKRKLVSPQDAAKVVRSGDRVYSPVFAAYPKGTLNALFDMMKEIEGVSISSMAMPSPIVDIFSKLEAAGYSAKSFDKHVCPK